MKHYKYFLIFLFILYSDCIFSQTSMFTLGDRRIVFLDNAHYSLDSLDKNNMQVKYTLTCGGSFYKDRKNEFAYVLSVGNNISKFQSAQLYSSDSLARIYEDLSPSMMLALKYPSIVEHTNYINFYDAYYTDLVKNKVIYTGRIVSENFRYSEDIPDLKWELCDTTQVIMGLLSQKAKCHFRGRDYIAWFSPEVPVYLGPWKFSGLPGLILLVYDTENKFSFRATHINEASSGNISIPQYDFTDISRKEFLKIRRQYIEDYYVTINRFSTGGIKIEPSDDNVKKANKENYDLLEFIELK